MVATFSKKKVLLLLCDVALIVTVSCLASWLTYGKSINILSFNTGATTLTLFFYLICLYVFDLYNADRSFHCRNDLARIIVAIGTGGGLSSSLFYILHHWQYERELFFWQVLLAIILITLWRQLYGVLFSKAIVRQRALIIGAGRCGHAIYELLKGPLSPYQVEGFLDDDPQKQGRIMNSPAVMGLTDRLVPIANKLEAKTAILAITHDRSSRLLRNVLDGRLNGIRILEMPSLFENLTRRVPVEHIHEQWLLLEHGFNVLSREYIKKVKRLVDIITSAAILTFTAPIIAITALAIRLDSPGPIFFKQERVGCGKVFVLWKFRSMCQDAEKFGAVWAQKKDPRVTRVGKWIRLLRIDELPQLWNVLLGDMSLIGPRPERPEFVKELEKVIPYYFIRHSVKPGISGWAQINYPYGASVEDALHKLEYDLYYVKNMSPILDMKIFLKTIGVVLFGQGAR